MHTHNSSSVIFDEFYGKYKIIKHLLTGRVLYVQVRVQDRVPSHPSPRPWICGLETKTRLESTTLITIGFMYMQISFLLCIQNKYHFFAWMLIFIPFFTSYYQYLLANLANVSRIWRCLPLSEKYDLKVKLSLKVHFVILTWSFYDIIL